MSIKKGWNAKLTIAFPSACLGKGPLGNVDFWKLGVHLFLVCTNLILNSFTTLQVIKIYNMHGPTECVEIPIHKCLYNVYTF